MKSDTLDSIFEQEEAAPSTNGRRPLFPDPPERATPVRHENEYIWSPEGDFEFHLTAYVIQRFIRANAQDVAVVREKRRGSFKTGPNKERSVCADGLWVFSYERKLFQYEACYASDTHRLSSLHPVDAMTALIEQELRENNPIRRQHMQFVRTGPRNGLCTRIRPRPRVTLADVILPDPIKEDLFNNTIFHLQHLEGNNGLIFHGPPGTGKSITCEALIGAALDAGYSSCYMVGKPDFAELENYLDRYLGPSLLVFEDIDSFGEDRIRAHGHNLSDFLQFLSGLSERPQKLVVIATTNHIDLLDTAIRNRPVRFNRRYAFDYPAPAEIDRLIDLHFRAERIPQTLRARCHGRKLTGAHIREIHRTATLHEKRYGLSVPEAFAHAVSTIVDAFCPRGDGQIGFDGRMGL